MNVAALGRKAGALDLGNLDRLETPCIDPVNARNHGRRLTQDLPSCVILVSDEWIERMDNLTQGENSFATGTGLARQKYH